VEGRNRSVMSMNSPCHLFSVWFESVPIPLPPLGPKLVKMASRKVSEPTYVAEPPSEKRNYDREDLSAQEADGHEFGLPTPGRYQVEDEETHRSLKGRQISMIAIGGAIGGPYRSRINKKNPLLKLSEYRHGIGHWLGELAGEIRSGQLIHQLRHHGHRVKTSH